MQVSEKNIIRLRLSHCMYQTYTFTHMQLWFTVETFQATIKQVASIRHQVFGLYSGQVVNLNRELDDKQPVVGDTLV